MSELASPLLPGNATALEEELARLAGRLDEIDPSIIATIWDAWRCPAPLLPWLAWALSVDVWDDGWSDIVKRQAIADSPDYHRRKGSRRAVEAALALAGRPYELTEWFDRVPTGRRGTSTLHVNADFAEAAAIFARVRPLVAAAKPKARSIFFGVGDVVTGAFGVTSGVAAEALVVIDPFVFSVQNPNGAFVASWGTLAEELTTIEAH